MDKERWEELRETFAGHEQFRITFKKKDGSLRVMICTRDLSLIPPDKHPKGTGKVNYSSMPVFDLEKNNWRSFSLDSLIDIEPII